MRSPIYARLSRERETRLDITTNVICIVLTPWAGHRRGTTVAVPARMAWPLQRRGVLEIVVSGPSRDTATETPVQAAAPSDTPEAPRRRGRPPRAK